MIKKILFRYPTYYDGKGDISKKWFVSWYEWNEERQELERKREYGVLNQLPVSHRLKEAERMIQSISERLEATFQSPEHYVKTLAEYLLDLCNGKKMLRDKSAATYKVFSNSLISYLIRNKLTNLEPRQFTIKQAFAYMDYLKQQGYSPTTWNNYRNFTKTYFFELKRRRIITENPFIEIPPLKAAPKRHVAFSDEQRDLLTSYMVVRSTRLLLFVSFVYYCFIRPGRELCNLKIKHIDFTNKKIVIPADIAKNKCTAWVVIPDKFHELLTTYELEKEDPELYVFGYDLMPRKYAANYDDPGRIHKNILKELNIPNGADGCTVYSWKHTGAINAVKAGCNLKDLQLQLRHHSLEEVDTYLRGLGMEASSELRGKFPEI